MLEWSNLTSQYMCIKQVSQNHREKCMGESIWEVYGYESMPTWNWALDVAPPPSQHYSATNVIWVTKNCRPQNVILFDIFGTRITAAYQLKVFTLIFNNNLVVGMPEFYLLYMYTYIDIPMSSSPPPPCHLTDATGQWDCDDEMCPEAQSHRCNMVGLA